MRLALSLPWVCLVWGIACSDDSGGEAPEADLQTQVRTLHREVTNDLVLIALEEVEEAMAEDLPVRAAELLETGAIPAARRQAERVGALDLSHPRAIELRDRAAARLSARTDALDAYRRALQRGLVEDVTLLDALQKQREAEEAIDELLGQLEAIAPLESRKNQG